MAARIHILGASGTGTSTLGRNLATRLGSQSFDSDDFFWQPTDPPFRLKRPPAERTALMEALFLPRADWILAGSFMGWGQAVEPRMTHVVFLDLDTETRLERIRARERRRNGAAIAPGGPLEPAHRSFLDWAACYDDPTFDGRSRVQHETWLARQQVPVIRLDAGLSPAALAEAALAALDLPSEGD